MRQVFVKPLILKLLGWCSVSRIQNTVQDKNGCDKPLSELQHGSSS